MFPSIRLIRSFSVYLPAILLWSSLLLVFTPAYGQSRAELEKKRRQHEQEIKVTKKLLQETQKKQKVTLNQLEIIGQQIGTRNKLINTIGDEIDLTGKRIIELDQTITTLQADLQSLKDHYAKLILLTYKHRNMHDKIMYILSAESFDQALKRIKSLQLIAEYRQKQATLIVTTQTQLKQNMAELQATKAEKEVLLVDKEREKQELEEDKKEESKVLAGLKNKEKDLRKQLVAKEAAAKRLKKAIEDLIEREIAAARKRAEEEARRKNAATGGNNQVADTKKGSSEMTLTPEAAQLANEFNRNKGTLPWPVEQGFVSKSFGVHPHPTLKNITVNNTGTDITTTKGARARAIFKGEVKMKFFVPGMGYAVIIAHGDYYTVYTNLEEVFVKPGDKVVTKQEIGTVMMNEVEEKAELHIEIYKGKVRLNPEDWMFRK